MNDWKLLQKDPSEALALLHFYSIRKKHAGGEVEVRITVKEFASAKTSDMKYFASADVCLNQNSMPFHPAGWGESQFIALSECLRNLRKFEYEDCPEPSAAGQPSPAGAE